MEIKQSHPVYTNNEERLERLKELKMLCKQRLQEGSGEEGED